MDKDFVKVIDSEIPKDSVLISVGLPGSWKSPVMEEIAKRKGFQILRSDIVRLEVLKGLDVFDQRVASNPENRKKVYDEMFRQAAEALQTSTKGLILDATFFSQELRSKAVELAQKANRTFVIAECVCTEEKSIERILRRTKENYESNALTREAYLNNRALFQPVDINDLKKRFETVRVIHLTIDTEYDSLPDWKITMIEKN
jgi:hypothetical protein